VEKKKKSKAKKRRFAGNWSVFWQISPGNGSFQFPAKKFCPGNLRKFPGQNFWKKKVKTPICGELTSFSGNWEVLKQTRLSPNIDVAWTTETLSDSHNRAQPSYVSFKPP